FHSTVRNPIENAVGISADRHRPHAGAFGRAACAFGPARYSCDDEADTPLNRRCKSGIVKLEPTADVFEVLPRRRGEDHLHERRNFAKAAATSSSVAKRPCSASRSPRSIPSISSGDGLYAMSL